MTQMYAKIFQDNGEDLDQSVHAQKLTRSAKLYMISWRRDAMTFIRN